MEADVISNLLRLPFFMGMSREELQHVMAKTKMDFGKHCEGDVLAYAGEKCGKMLIVINGEVDIERQADGGLYKLSETLHAPVVIRPEGLFGRFQFFTSNVTARTPVSTITIEKNEIQKLMASSLIFRLNLLSFLSTSLQKCDYDIWQSSPSSLERRIINFFRRRCATPTGHKTFKIRMLDLADILNTSRLETSQALNKLQAAGLVKLSRGKVDIPSMQNLINCDM